MTIIYVNIMHIFVYRKTYYIHSVVNILPLLRSNTQYLQMTEKLRSSEKISKAIYN